MREKSFFEPLDALVVAAAAAAAAAAFLPATAALLHAFLSLHFHNTTCTGPNSWKKKHTHTSMKSFILDIRIQQIVSIHILMEFIWSLLSSLEDTSLRVTGFRTVKFFIVTLFHLTCYKFANLLNE